MRTALHAIHSLIHYADLNPETLFDKIIRRNVKGTKALLKRLKKHHPEELPKILHADDDGLIPLSYATSTSRERHDEHYQIAIALLEAGADPHARMRGEFEGQTVIQHAVRDQILHEIRLLIWYGPEDFLAIPVPKSDATIEVLLRDWSFLERCHELATTGRSDSSPEGPIMDVVKITTALAQERFNLMQKAEQALQEGLYLKAVEHYVELNKICQDNAEIEDKIYYSEYYSSSQPHLVRFYQEYGKRYLRCALKICQEKIASLKKQAPLSLESMMTLKPILEAVIKISKALQDEKNLKCYQQKLERVNAQLAANPNITARAIPALPLNVDERLTISSPPIELFAPPALVTAATTVSLAASQKSVLLEDPIPPTP